MLTVEHANIAGGWDRDRVSSLPILMSEPEIL